MKTNPWASAIIFVISGILVLSTTAGATQIYKDGAKTSPPPSPLEFQIQGVFNPNHLYLQDGTNQIAKTTTAGQVKLKATTYAEETVDTIGITFYLQQWNGSSWKGVGAGADYSADDKDAYSNSVTRSVEVGYYYRARTIHWVTEEGTYEQGERVSDYILVD